MGMRYRKVSEEMILIGHRCKTCPQFDGTPVWMTCQAGCRCFGTALLGSYIVTHSLDWYESEPIPAIRSATLHQWNRTARGVPRPTRSSFAPGRFRRWKLGAGSTARPVECRSKRSTWDIIAMDDMIRISPDPILPHPRMHERGLRAAARYWMWYRIGGIRHSACPHGRCSPACRPQHVRRLSPSHLREDKGAVYFKRVNQVSGGLPAWHA